MTGIVTHQLRPRGKTDPHATGAQDWWQGATIYQVYPRSFLDSNGDGIGDLRGIIKGLDYIASLDVDAIWISPFFKSPMRDFGYDVSDMRAVDPIFGTLEDFDELVEQAHRLNLRVIIDQVYSHTSEEHAWFEDSRSSRTSSKADWYVWADAKPDGAPPNNWQSVFGGAAWEWDARRQQYYLHNFLSSQPDLNLHNPQVQSEILDTARFWLDRGVDGFRLDAINFIMHDQALRDNPPSNLPLEEVTRPFDMQQHTYNQSAPKIVGFIERLQSVVSSYPGRFTVAEVGGPDPYDEMKAFIHGRERLNSAYSFDFLYADKITPASVRTALEIWDQENDGWPSWAFSNHDAPRAVSRWVGEADRDLAAKMLLLLLLSLRGNVFVYQGEELGLPQAHIPFHHLQDPEAIANWPRILGRDGARTPLPWSVAQPYSGFSDKETWLPIDLEQAKLSIEHQTDDPQSCLAFARTAISERGSRASLRTGALRFLNTPENVLAFVREEGDEATLCVFNLGPEVINYQPDDASLWQSLLPTDQKVSQGTGLPEQLGAYSGYWASREK